MIMLISLWALGTLTSCSDGKLPEYESTYFKYAVETKDDGSKVGYLIGFTELGLEQTHLILPEELDGIKIRGFGYDYSKEFVWGTLEEGWEGLTNLNLKIEVINSKSMVVLEITYSVFKNNCKILYVFCSS